ncbi:hypothetical protein V1478_011842 [Vespula squamosa]|uniref:Uncharacterized protein n=1 Tax=Vespula squamosa TaxID=30214 RepID=A0ABD2AC24_VESSQ
MSLIIKVLRSLCSVQILKQYKIDLDTWSNGTIKQTYRCRKKKNKKIHPMIVLSPMIYLSRKKIHIDHRAIVECKNQCQGQAIR